jgi:HEAT repeat protein
MELDRIKADLSSPDSQARLKALTALRQYDADVAVPLLQSKLHDAEFIIRSFVAMGLGRKQSETAFASLLQILKGDRDYNVRAEAANSLSLYGEPSLSYLVDLFRRDENWLVRRSILAAIQDMSAVATQTDALYEICDMGTADEDLTVKEASISALGQLAGSDRQEEAIAKLLHFANEDSWRTRYHAALALKHFDDPSAKAALGTLSQDTDHRVVGATLERLI